jgi:hypothetical protein
MDNDQSAVAETLVAGLAAKGIDVEIATPETKRKPGDPGPVASVKKGTPYRKSIIQDVTSIPGKVRYYHATKGWRVRTITEQPNIMRFWQTIARAQMFKQIGDAHVQA